jgi:hypothetical protein
MDQDTDWRRFRDDLGQGAARAGIGVVRITLLFGAAAAALALIATPYLDRESRTRIARVDRTGIDTMATGSILRGDSFTVRRRRHRDPNASSARMAAHRAIVDGPLSRSLTAGRIVRGGARRVNEF